MTRLPTGVANGVNDEDEALMYVRQRDAVLDRMRAVKALHFAHRKWREAGNQDEYQDRCDECNQLWPCRTTRVATGGSDEI